MKKGFTLIEVMVSVSIFTMVMLVATGSVFAIVEANKKTHSIKSVMTNLNFALESMMREIRLGYHYACYDTANSVSLSSTQNCPSGPGGSYTSNMFRFKANRDIDLDGAYDGSNMIQDQIQYSLSGGRIMKDVFGTNASSLPITATEVRVTSLQFYVTGAGVGGGQPKVVMVVRGDAGSGDTQSSFNIETTVSQRSIDS